jgi:mRNA-degrading endonuclease RelE of RelBE toxin-antitoxin system
MLKIGIIFSMAWTVHIKKKVQRNIRQLPDRIQYALKILIKEIAELGPVRGNWQNYSSLPDNRHHCHLKHGHPTYVAVWEVTDKDIKITEVIYAGTHEKAPY